MKIIRSSQLTHAEANSADLVVVVSSQLEQWLDFPVEFLRVFHVAGFPSVQALSII